MKNHIILNPAQISELNDLCYKMLVSENNINFKFPFTSGSDRYFDVIGINNDVVIIDQRMQALSEIDEEVAVLLSGAKFSYEELVTMGKLIMES